MRNTARRKGKWTEGGRTMKTDKERKEEREDVEMGHTEDKCK